MIQHMDANKYNTAQNRYNTNNTADSFWEPAFAQDVGRPPTNLSVHRRTPSNAIGRLVWRFKKRVASAIYQKYHHDMQQAFLKWREYVKEKEEWELRNLVLKRLILSKNREKLKTAITQLKLHTRSQKVTESVNKTLVNRWRKRYIFKVFKILRKQSKEGRKGSKKVISKKSISH